LFHFPVANVDLEEFQDLLACPRNVWLARNRWQCLFSFRASENVWLYHFAFSATGSFKQPSQRRKWRCEAESVDTNETVAAGEQKVSQVKESLTEKQGPPVLTILAGLVGAVLVIWGLWSLISAILGFFFH